MSDETRKLLAPEDEAPPSEEELAASARLRDALAGAPLSSEAADLARALKAAWEPDPIAGEDHAGLLDDLPSPAELAAAEQLRAALEGGAAPPEPRDAALARALAAAWAPGEIDPREHRALVDRALGAPGGGVVALRRRPAVRVAFAAAAGGLALAAGLLVWIGAPPDEAPLARARSTQPLFDEPFRAGETSARIDRIALARAGDYRENRFTRWGVR
jgi:hypothetical protein